MPDLEHCVDCETSKKLTSPYVVVYNGIEPFTTNAVYLNISTLKKCEGNFVPASSSSPRKNSSENFYRMALIVQQNDIILSETLIGHIPESNLKKLLPATYKWLKRHFAQ